MKSLLYTKRLDLIPLNVDDFELLHSTFTDPFVREYLWDNKVIGAETTRDILSINEQQFDTSNWGLWKIFVRNTNAYAGIVGLWIFFNEAQPQLLYALLPDKTGFGYATEASRTIIDYAFNKLNNHPIHLSI